MKKLILTIIAVVTTMLCFAQPGGGPLGTPTPIDGGVLMLLAAGAGYGYKKMRKKKSTEE